MNLIAIRTMGDPRPALYRWATQINTGTAFVVASGDDDEVAVSGGKMLKAALREQVAELSQIYDTTIFILDRNARETLYSGLQSRLANASALEQLDLIRSRRQDSYGVASDEVFMFATLIGADTVQFGDDDTIPLPGIDVVDRHRDIIASREAVAVTGGYLGAHWLDASFFPSAASQACFVSSFMRHIPTRRPVVDTALPTSSAVDEACDYLIGGNSMIHAELFKVLCCPVILESIGTDDLFFGNFASRLFNGRVRRSGIPVIHAHNAGRKEPKAVLRYFRNCARAIAFWAMLDEQWWQVLAAIAKREAVADDLPAVNVQRACNALAEFCGQLKLINQDAAGRISPAVTQIIEALSDDASGLAAFGEDVVATASAGLQEYARLLAAWPVILSALDEELRDRVIKVARC